MKSLSLKAATLIGGLAALLGSTFLPACSASPGSEDPAGQQSSASSTTQNGLLKSEGSYCLDVYGDSQQTGASVDIATCNGTTAQTFTFTVGAYGPIVNTHSGMCLDDVLGGGAALQMVPCNGKPEQQWNFWGSAASSMVIEDQSGHCLDVLGNTQRSGQTADPAHCNGTGAQVWALYPLPPVCGALGKTACPTSTPNQYTCNSGLAPRGFDGSSTVLPSVICCPPADSNQANICCPAGNINENGSCAACGSSGKPACSGGGCNSGLVSVNGTCEPCGATGHPACAGGTCNGTDVSVSGTCQPCGALNSGCCANEKCNGSLVCEPTSAGNRCISSGTGSSSGGSSSGGSTCGGSNGPCPCQSDGTCGKGQICEGNTCYECGETGGICCNVDKYNSTQCSSSDVSCNGGSCAD